MNFAKPGPPEVSLVPPIGLKVPLGDAQIVFPLRCAIILLILKSQFIHKTGVKNNLWTSQKCQNNFQTSKRDKLLLIVMRDAR